MWNCQPPCQRLNPHFGEVKVLVQGLGKKSQRATPDQGVVISCDLLRNVTRDSHSCCHTMSRLLSHNAMRDCLAFFNL